MMLMFAGQKCMFGRCLDSVTNEPTFLNCEKNEAVEEEYYQNEAKRIANRWQKISEMMGQGVRVALFQVSLCSLEGINYKPSAVIGPHGTMCHNLVLFRFLQRTKNSNSIDRQLYWPREVVNLAEETMFRSDI